jgi:hypothetical protein
LNRLGDRRSIGADVGNLDVLDQVAIGQRVQNAAYSENGSDDCLKDTVGFVHDETLPFNVDFRALYRLPALQSKELV